MTCVYVTGAGDRYHASDDCIGLRSGQEGGQAQGYDLREIVDMELSSAIAAGKTACKSCGGTTP
jgi:hypothetical protein